MGSWWSVSRFAEGVRVEGRVGGTGFVGFGVGFGFIFSGRYIFFLGFFLGLV